MFLHTLLDLINEPDFYIEVPYELEHLERYDAETIPNKYRWYHVLCIGTYHGVICISIQK